MTRNIIVLMLLVVVMVGVSHQALAEGFIILSQCDKRMSLAIMGDGHDEHVYTSDDGTTRKIACECPDASTGDWTRESLAKHDFCCSMKLQRCEENCVE